MHPPHFDVRPIGEVQDKQAIWVSVFDKEKVQDALKAVLFRALWWDLLLEMLLLNFAVRVTFNCLELEIKGSETVMAYNFNCWKDSDNSRKELNIYVICNGTRNILEKTQAVSHHVFLGRARDARNYKLLAVTVAYRAS